MLLEKLFKPSARDEEDDKLEDIMNNRVREALGLNRTWGAQSNAVFSNLRGDFMKPVTEIGNVGLVVTCLCLKHFLQLNCCSTQPIFLLSSTMGNWI